MRSHVLVLCAAACWCAAILAAPAAVNAADGPIRAAGGAAYVFFSTLCHQWDSHSFHLFGHKLPVCIRCTAIYFSFFAGVALYPAIGKKMERRFGSRSMLMAAAAGMMTDVAFSSLGILQSSTATRLITGGAFGFLSALVLTPILHEITASFGRTAS